MKIGITGQNGFIGRHLYNYLSTKEGIELIPFEKVFFEKEASLDSFILKCDVVVHLAAMNRHEDQEFIYKTNISLVNKIVSSCERTNAKPHVLISSSTQESNNNMYGLSKREGREILEDWALRNGAISTGLIIPNVFGPFGRPNYNSVVATFCNQLINNERPEIIKDGMLKLIYVNKLVEQINTIIQNAVSGKVVIEHAYECTVSELLSKLSLIKTQYMDNGEFPSLMSSFELDLFNSFRCYIPEDFYPRPFTKHSDNRGSFVEIVRANTNGQFSFSTTVPGITRGNHFHTRKAERFAVIKGKARINLRKIDSEKIISYELDGNQPSYVDMPIWYTHNITNIGDEELVTLFWINEPYNSEDADTYFVNV